MKQLMTAYEEFQQFVRSSQCTPELKNAPVVAVLCGPSPVIEAIVREASKDCGQEMDWGYIGGRGFVHSNGDRVKARSALFQAIPQSDLSQGDL